MTQQIPKHHSKYRGNFCVALHNTGPVSVFLLGSLYLVASEFVLASYWIGPRQYLPLPACKNFLTLGYWYMKNINGSSKEQQGYMPTSTLQSDEQHTTARCTRPTSYTMDTWSFLGVMRQQRGADHPPTSSAEVKERA